MANPFDQFDTPSQGGPVYGPPPVVDPYKQASEARAERDQQLQEQTAIRAAEDQAMQREKFEWEKVKQAQDRAAGVGVAADTTEGERKAGAFLIRALGANDSYEGTGVGPRSYVGQGLANNAPDFLNILPEFIGNSPERQVADSAQDEFIAASLRQDSGAAIPPEELERQRRIYFPMPGDTDETIAQKRMARLRAIEGLKQSAGSLAAASEERYRALQEPKDGEYGSANPTPPQLTPSGQGYNLADQFKTVEDPEMAAVADEYRKRLAAGQRAGEIIPWLRSTGASPQTLMAAMKQIQYRNENPNVPIDSYSITATRQEPLSTFENVATDIGGSAPGAFAIGAGQFLSGNTLDNLTADPERARLAMAIAEAENPGATFAGELTGGILGAMTGEAGLARMGMASGLGRGLLADTAMGAANGAGAADDGSRLIGAAQGGVAAAAGSAGGTLAMKGMGRALTPTGGRLADLYAEGVRPTPGQRFVESGVLGRAVNATEEALQSVPIVGAAISGARQEARDQFQIGAFNQALREIGEELPAKMKPGTDPHKFAQEAFSRIYDEARSGMRLVADEELSNDISSLAPDIATLGPQAQNKLKAIIANTIKSDMSGEAYKLTMSDLGKHIARNRKGLMADDQALADVLENIRDSLDSAARRHSDPEAVALLDKADAGYAKLVRIEEAAMRRGGDDGTFTPAGFDSAVQKTSGGVRSKAYLRGDAQMQDYANQGKNLSDRISNSGTTDRALTVGGLAGAGYGVYDPTVGAILGTIGAAYAPGVRQATKGVLAPSRGKRKAIAARLQRIERITGAGSAAAGVQASIPSQ